MAQAATAEGVPWEEKGKADVFTMEELRGEIVSEIRYHAQEEQRAVLHSALERQLLGSVGVQCEWGTPQGSTGPESAQNLKHEEDLAAVLQAVAEREGWLANVDNDQVER